MEKVEKVVCDFYNVPTSKLHVGNRVYGVLKAKQVFCWIMYKKHRATYKAICNYLNMANHTSILHSVRVVTSEIEVNEAYRQEIEQIQNKLKFI